MRQASLACTEQVLALPEVLARQCYTVVDEHEVEIQWEYFCACGHMFDPEVDAGGVAFSELPAAWPCPSCGQRARTWYRMSTWHSDEIWNRLVHSDTFSLDSTALTDSTRCTPRSSQLGSISPASSSRFGSEASNPECEDTDGIPCVAGSHPRVALDVEAGAQQWQCDHCDAEPLSFQAALGCKACRPIVSPPFSCMETGLFEADTCQAMPDHVGLTGMAPSAASGSARGRAGGAACLGTFPRAAPGLPAVPLAADQASLPQVARRRRSERTLRGDEAVDSPRVPPVESAGLRAKAGGRRLRTGVGSQGSPVRPGQRAAGDTLLRPWWGKQEHRLLGLPWAPSRPWSTPPVSSDRSPFRSSQHAILVRDFA